MNKKIIYNHKARKALEAGINVLAKAVSVTLGPKGKNVVLGCEPGAPQIVNDGITIAKEIELKNPLQNVGVSLIRQAALKTNEVVGDGTTTVTILAHAIVKEGIKSIVAGGNPVLIKRGMHKSVRFMIEKISEYAKPILNIEDIVQIASVSSGNNSRIGQIIANAFEKIGREGVISLEEGNSMNTCLQIVDGMSFNKGYISPYFLSNSMHSEIIQDNPWILLTDKKIKRPQEELVPLLEQIALTSRPLLIIAEEVEKEALSTLILNKMKGIINVVAVRAPGFGETKKDLLEDIALLTNGTVISDKLGLSLEKSTLDFMGSAKRVIIKKNLTTIVSNINKKDLSLRSSSIKKQMELSNNKYEKQKLQDRLSKLSGSIAIIKLGATTPTEMTEKKLRCEDAIHATKAALEEGVVPGGGSTLLHLSSLLQLWASKNLSSDELLGAQILAKALLVPLYTIVTNAGNNGSVITEALKHTEFQMGYDANNYCIADMYKVGIIDSAKVTRLAIQNASSIASMILTTDCLVSDCLV